MTIEWNKVTWYSKLLAVIIFVATFWIAFYLGEQYRELNSAVVDSKSDYVLSVNNTLMLGDLSIKLNSISDSRCPSDVQCIWEGRVDAEVTFTEGIKKETKELSIGKDPITFSDYKISLLAVNPYPKSKKQIKQSDYKVTVHIDK